MSRDHEIIGLEGDLRAQTLISFYDYWSSLPVKRRYPWRHNVDPVAIPALLPWLFMIDVAAPLPEPRFRYRLAGTEIVRLYGVEFTGLTVQQAFPDRAEALSADYAEALRVGQPTYRRYPLPVRGRDYRSVERLICPLATDGENVDMLIGVISPCRIHPRAWSHRAA